MIRVARPGQFQTKASSAGCRNRPASLQPINLITGGIPMIFIHTKDYKQCWSFDNSLSFKAQAIMWEIVRQTYPDEETGEPCQKTREEFIDDLLSSAKDGISSLNSGIKELRQKNYLKSFPGYNKELKKIEWVMEVMTSG